MVETRVGTGEGNSKTLNPKPKKLQPQRGYAQPRIKYTKVPDLQFENWLKYLGCC